MPCISLAANASRNRNDLIFKRMSADYSDDILNAALALSVEWGENFRKPIGERLLARFADIEPDDMAHIEQVVKDAEYLIYSLGEKELAGEITESEITRFARDKFPWLDAANAARLKNIAMYYARR